MKRSIKLWSVFTAVLLVVVTGLPRGTQAWSSEGGWHRFAPAQQAAADVCRPLLLIRFDESGGALRKAALSDRAAAGGAALGLFLGVRSAVGLREETAPRKIDIAAQRGESRARAIAQYRHCRSQQALHALAANENL